MWHLMLLFAVRLYENDKNVNEESSKILQRKNFTSLGIICKRMIVITFI